QVAGPSRVGLELPPQLRDVDVQVVRLGVVSRPPDFTQDRRMRQQLSLVSREQTQEIELIRRQRDGLPPERDCPLVEVDEELTDLEDRPRLGRRSAESGSQPRQQL